MKVTKETLKKIIKEELFLITEDRQEHISGISEKITRLEQELSNVQAKLDEEDATGEQHDDLMSVRSTPYYTDLLSHRYGITGKLELLYKQLRELSSGEEGKGGVGRLSKQ